MSDSTSRDELGDEAPHGPTKATAAEAKRSKQPPIKVKKPPGLKTARPPQEPRA